jgi:hypothetical protein
MPTKALWRESLYTIGMSTDNQSLRRLTENEAVFRRHNEQVQQGLDELTQVADKRLYQDIFPEVDGLVLQFYCECADENCHQRLSLKLEEYRRIHEDRSRFVVAPGHATMDAERLVERHDDYFVVEKFLDPPEQPTTLHKTDVDND